MIDFDSLVLAPSMDAFAETVTVASQPGALPYSARAIFTSRPLNVALSDGMTLLADQETTIGFRLSEFAVPPGARDVITIRGVQFIGVDYHVDGQGGGQLTLRRTKPAGSTALPASYTWPAAALFGGDGELAASTA